MGVQHVVRGPLPVTVKNRTGARVGRLTVADYYGKAPSKWGGVHHWICRCDCGGEAIVTSQNLSTGQTTSCGCWRSKQSKDVHTKHGKALSPEWIVWSSMRARCSNPKTKQWHRYGGRGISVCAEWSEDFARFLKDMGPRPSMDHSIERINNDGNYEPGNCRWATKKEQARNRRTSRILHWRGRDMTLAEAVELSGLPISTVDSRIRKGWETNKALEAPLMPNEKSIAKALATRWGHNI